MVANNKLVILPDAYPHGEHSSQFHRDIAQRGLFFYVIAGSQAQGTSIDGGDQDLVGITFPPLEQTIGIADQKFEQYQYHTAWRRPGGLSNRSIAGDLDITVYSAQKFVRLACDGNPNILEVLYTNPEHIIYRTTDSVRLMAIREHFLSKAALHKYLGYMTSQIGYIDGSKSPRVNRPELIQKHGYDTKYASHAIRLGIEGITLAKEGTIIMPKDKIDAGHIIDVKNGLVSKQEVMEEVKDMTSQLRYLLEHNNLPDKPNLTIINRWLIYNNLALDRYVKGW